MMSLVIAIERIARHRALKHVNRLLVAAIALSCLLSVREVVNIAFTDHTPPAQTGKAGAKAAGKVAPLSNYNKAVSNNPFGIKGQTLSTITRQQLSSAEDAQEASVTPTVEIKLLGTVAWSDGFGYVFVSEGGSEQKMYKSSQEISGAGTIAAVFPELVQMEFNGQSYEVLLEEFTEGNGKSKAKASRKRPASGTPRDRKGGGKDFSQFARRTGDNEFVVSKQAIDESIQNPQNVLTDARLLPNMEGGKQNGFKVSEIKPNGLYQHLGLKNGDVLLEINSFKLASPESALQAFTALQGASSIKIELKRGGKNISLKYNIR